MTLRKKKRHRTVELRPGYQLEALADKKKANVKVIFPHHVLVRVVKRD